MAAIRPSAPRCCLRSRPTAWACSSFWASQRYCFAEPASFDPLDGELLLDVVLVVAAGGRGGEKSPRDLLADRGVLQDRPVVEFDLEHAARPVVARGLDSAAAYRLAFD